MHSFTFNKKLQLESGAELGPITLAYETWGELNRDQSNAVLIEHAFSGNAHAAGPGGWWEEMIGSGKAFDTDKYFVICSNVIGGCSGSTGPASINPESGQAYGLTFPLITIKDMVEAQKLLLDHLKIKKLLCVAGGSMGGMQALQWVASYPDKVASAIPIACTLKHSPQQIAFNEVGRQSVLADPEKGLAIARMIGHITYMSEASMEEKFSRKLKSGEYSFTFNPDFEVEGYLRYRGDSFIKRFDPNSYLYITRAMDYFDLSGEKLAPKGKKIHTNFLVIAFKSDWLYPPSNAKEIVKLLKTRAAHASYVEINATHGHDSFLIELDEQIHLIKHFLAKNFKVKHG